MCGIIVTIGAKSEQITRECLQKISHRGPDAVSIYSTENISIGFCRLAINDISSKANQPFQFGHLIGVFNAEIYNHATLAQEHNIHTNSKSDCEIILPLYSKMGEKILDLLDGFYSGVIYDSHSKKIIVIRDSLGKKPLFYAKKGNRQYIVSELKALNGMDTFQILPKGMSTITGPAVELLHSHELQNNVSRTDATGIKNILINAVQKRIMGLGNQKLGVFISGGLDSSIIAFLLHKMAKKNQVRYYYLADEKSTDHGYIQKLIEHLAIPSEQITGVRLPTKETMLRLISKIIYATESRNPSIISNGIAISLLAEKAKDDNLKVVFTGDGADEVFLGYYSNNNVSRDNFRECQTGLLNDLHFTELRRIDQASMMHSIETRCPFLDKELIAQALNMEFSDFINGSEQQYNKYILRQAFHQDLPQDIIWREKTSMDVGSGIQKLAIDVINSVVSTELLHYKQEWNNHFLASHTPTNDKYFWSYPTFDKYLANRADKWISDRRIDKEQAKQIIAKEWKVCPNSLEFLGAGSEGKVFTDNKKVYKIIDYHHSKPLLWRLQAFSESIKKVKSQTSIPNFSVVQISEHDEKISVKEKFITLAYNFEKTDKLGPAKNVSRQAYLTFLQDLKKIGWTYPDFQPKNLRVTLSGALLGIDIGAGIHPYSQRLHESSIRRAFVTYKFLSNNQSQNFKKKFLTPQNLKLTFPKTTSPKKDITETQFITEYEAFKAEADDIKPKASVQIIEQEMLNFMIKTPFHNLFQLYNLKEITSSILGGTCSDRALLFQKLLTEKFSNSNFKVLLHRAIINGKQTHTLLRIELNKRIYFSDVGMGFPIVKLIPADTSICFESHGYRFETKIIDEEQIIVDISDHSSSNELMSFSITEQDQLKVAEEILNRMNRLDEVPFNNKLRYFFFEHGKYFQIIDNDLKVNPINNKVNAIKQTKVGENANK